MRTRRKAGKEYEGAWGEVLASVNRQIAEGHRDPRRILAKAWNRAPTARQSDRRFRYYHAKLGVEPGSDGLPEERLAVHDGAYCLVPFHDAYPDAIVENTIEVLTAHPGAVDCVVELGSGTGRNLINLFRAAPDLLKGKVDLHACELTDSGREVTRALGRLCPDMDLSVHAFNYHAPDLSFLDGRRNVLFLTFHSVEQIPVLSPRVFDEMLDRSGNCSCLHFEPVGWQSDERLVQQRRLAGTPLGRLRLFLGRRVYKLVRSIDSALHTWPRRGFPGIELDRDDIGKPDRVSPNAAAWSLRFDYNTNLLSLLRTLEASCRITIETQRLNVSGDNPFNPTSVILWTKNP